jgi:hypothetical protein
MKHIKVPMELNDLAVRVVHAYESTKALRGHQTLERGAHHHLMMLFLEIDRHQSLWRSSYLMGMKHELEVLINETSLFLVQTDMNRFVTNMHNFKNTL